jgi:hypothetical protein
MARNGSGIYSLPNNSWYPAVNGVTATAADWNTLASDLQTAITQSVSADGQTPMTGNLPFGANRATGLAAGVAPTDGVNLGQVSGAIGIGLGQCRLVKSGANIVLQPYKGNRISINGAIYAIPAAGASLAPTGLAPGTLYYIYAYMVGTVVTLEAATTAHLTDTTTGVEIKSGDPSRTLVGMVRPIAGPAFADTGVQRFVASWFNRRGMNLLAGFTVVRTTTSAVYAEVNTEIRNEFLCWAFDPLQSSLCGGVSIVTANAFVQTVIAIDGQITDTLSSLRALPTGAYDGPLATTLNGNFGEGYHYTTLFGRTTTGTASYYGGTGGDRCVLSSVVQI